MSPDEPPRQGPIFERSGTADVGAFSESAEAHAAVSKIQPYPRMVPFCRIISSGRSRRSDEPLHLLGIFPSGRDFDSRGHIHGKGAYLPDRICDVLRL